MNLPLPLNALTALTAAAAWGGGDFSGGMGVKAAGGSTTGALRVVIVAHAASLAVLLIILALTGSPWPHGWPLAWGLLAGTAAAFSLTAFYIALSRGAMGASAAISGLLAAAVPAAVSNAIEGAPGRMQRIGFLLAAAAIWLIAAGPAPANTSSLHTRTARQTTALALFGGIGFGFYFVALRLANPLGLVEPMALARAASLTVCLLLLFALTRRPHAAVSFGRGAWLGAIGVALLDTAGNLLFLASTRLGRLDIAAVLASLYPAGTILLAALWLHERPTPRQLLGMSIALAAVLLITL